jgi:hypothetical protein
MPHPTARLRHDLIEPREALTAERDRLEARTAVLERKHNLLQAQPYDADEHAAHRAELCVHLEDLRAFGRSLRTLDERRHRPRPKLSHCQ